MPELKRQTLLDEAHIYVKGGDGGNGIVSFRREKYVPFGGPDGGDGGRGGDVVLCAAPGVATFREFQFRRHFKAERGGHGAGKNKHGKNAQDLTVKVPLGTLVQADGELLADLTHPSECVVLVRGGRGGQGNARFATSTNRAPRVAERGEPGEERWLDLELKTIADVGMVGYPNVGKSSLLAAMSAARPKIGDYPFTTLAPNLGVASTGERRFVVADMPGLIAGAHEGAGLGHRFLRHIERAKVLLHVVDASTDDPLADYERVREELRLYNPSLVEKPHMLVANKMDVPAARANWAKLRRAVQRRKLTACPVSATAGEGIQELLTEVAGILGTLPQKQAAAPSSVKVYRYESEEGWTIEREDKAFRVRGRKVERTVAMTNADNTEALERLDRTLGRMGIFKALEAAGIQPGDTVRLGAAELEWGDLGVVGEGEWTTGQRRGRRS